MCMRGERVRWGFSRRGAIREKGKVRKEVGGYMGGGKSGGKRIGR